MSEFVTVGIGAGELELVVLPELGGKIGSLKARGEELLQGPLREYARRDAAGAFDLWDASGWDECLPSVAGCSVAGVEVPDHGDFWRVEWKVEEQAPDRLRMVAEGTSLPLGFEREIRVIEAGASGPARVVFGYRVWDTSGAAMPWAWSAHPLFAVDAGDRIVLPSSVEGVVVEGSGGGRLGGHGARHRWPVTVGEDGEALDLSLVGAADAGVGDKLFAAAPHEGWARLERRKLGLGVTVRFDPQECPWLGMWICYGGWPDSNSRKGYTVALEPCTAPVDSLAEAAERGLERVLLPGEQVKWEVVVEVAGLGAEV